MGDKGISIGEHSDVVFEDIVIRRADKAIASKDNSTPTMKNVLIEQSNIGLTVFQKKPEFGPSSLVVDGLELRDVTEPYLLEKGSTLVMNGKRLKQNSKNLRKRFYPGE